MKAWHKVIGIGFAASTLVVGCVVGNDDGDDNVNFDGGGGTGGGTTGGTGGATGGTGGATGGTGGMTGGTGGATGGTGGATGGTGGTGGTNFTCDPMSDPTADCDQCAQARCCTEWQDCVNDPTGACLTYDSQGMASGEMITIIECTDMVFTDTGAVTSGDVDSCAASAGPNGGIPGQAALDLTQCLKTTLADAGGDTNCGFICFSML